MKIISNNFESGRNKHDVKFVIVHTYNGKGRSLFNYFNDPNSGVSAHYAVFLDGNLEQYVNEEDTAWHAGNLDANYDSIGIEHQDNGKPDDSVRTDELYQASIKLISDIYLRYGWDKTNQGLIKPHYEYTTTGCPGGLDLDRIRTGVYNRLNPPQGEKESKDMMVNDLLRQQLKRIDELNRDLRDTRAEKILLKLELDTKNRRIFEFENSLTYRIQKLYERLFKKNK